MDKDDRRTEEQRRAAEAAAAKGNGTDTETARPYPDIPQLDALRIDPTELNTARLTPQCIVDAYLYADVAAFPGPGGTGKTSLALYESVHVVLGRPLYGLEVHKPGPVAIITAEDRREILIARLSRIMEAMVLNEAEQVAICKGVMIWDVSGAECRLTELDRGNVVLTGLADALVERFRDSPPVLMLLDPVISFGAGERIVNDNEHSLILAARRIVKGLGCCVRLIAHTGKQSARDGTLDQYAGRGGSALADGARMVAVLRAWEDDEEKDKLVPPAGLSVGSDEQIVVLARPKVSYAPPQQPHIWICRHGYAFQYFLATKSDPDAEAKAREDQLERFLVSELVEGRRHTKNTLEMLGTRLMTRGPLRAALSALMSDGRVWLERARRGGACVRRGRPMSPYEPRHEHVQDEAPPQQGVHGVSARKAALQAVMP